MSFKLLAIRPMKGCNPKFLKNLEEGRIYKFYNDYKFCSNEIELIGNDLKEITEIKLEETLIEDFFYQKNEDVITKINVSAIVGRNGSGKSALIELLVASIVKVSLKIDKNFINPHMLYEKGEDEKSKIKFNNSIPQNFLNCLI
ncbi:hypothetical protein [Chryseobacterium sp. S90]|uniref:hypothetical protein n=1 Tax=Chryseobacterium sp. S90 TaxID=3395373 RepID=UPI0039BD0742